MRRGLIPGVTLSAHADPDAARAAALEHLLDEPNAACAVLDRRELCAQPRRRTPLPLRPDRFDHTAVDVRERLKEPLRMAGGDARRAGRGFAGVRSAACDEPPRP